MNLRSIALITRKWLALNSTAVMLVLTLAAIYPTYKVLTNQSPIAVVSLNQVTLNLVILWGLWGWYSEALGKQKQWSKRKSWTVFVIGMVLIMVALRLGGMESAFG